MHYIRILKRIFQEPKRNRIFLYGTHVKIQKQFVHGQRENGFNWMNTKTH